MRATDPYHHPVSVHECLAPTTCLCRMRRSPTSISFSPRTSDGAASASESRSSALTTRDERSPSRSSRGDRLRDARQDASGGFPARRVLAGHAQRRGRPHLRRERHLGSLHGRQAVAPQELVIPHLGGRNEASGSYQVGLGAKLLRQYPWWRFTPHPEWSRRGHDVLRAARRGAAIAFTWTCRASGYRGPPGGSLDERMDQRAKAISGCLTPQASRAKCASSTCPTSSLISPAPPTIFSLEKGVRYHARYWEPSRESKSTSEPSSVPRPVLSHRQIASIAPRNATGRHQR